MMSSARRGLLLPKAALAAAVLLVAPALYADPDPAPSPTPAIASPPQTTPPAQPSPQDDQPRPWSLKPVVVTAQKRPELLQDVPQSITAISPETIRDAQIRQINDAAAYAPGVTISHFTNRRLSFPFVRGVGSGRNSPAVTTYYDGVPQLSFATSNLELVDIHDIEFLRGPQGTLYGRNSLGGIININSNPPANKLTLESTSTVGNFQFYDERAAVNLPLIKDVLAVRIAGGASARDGYTKNDFTGNDLDRKESEFGKIQIWFAPVEQLDFTLRLNAERDRDGDYPLGDLAALRARPWHVNHAFEGNSLRDVASASLTANYYSEYATLTSVTGFTDWRSQDVTGLDYSPLDLIRRNNREHQNDFTQEIRAASPKDNPIPITDQARLSWVAGVFLFASDYGQNASETFRPASLPILRLPFPFTQFDNAALNNDGAGAFGQVTLTLFDKLDLIGGVRFDAEHSHANLSSMTDSPFLPSSSAAPSADFQNVSTRWGAAYHWTPDLMSYADAAQGYKAGGFNPTSPANKVAFGPEQAWTYEVGTKSGWFKNRLTANLDYFYIDWRQMQLDVPTTTPGVYFIDNVGQAHSQGVELELTARPIENLELFGGASYVQSQFDRYTQPSGASAHGSDLPFAPDSTWNVGAEYSIKLCSQVTAFARAEEVGTGRYFYDASNAASQGAFAMTNVRAGLRGRHWSIQGWVENAFEAHSVPLAFPFQLAPSGYIGESGTPRLFGVSLRVDF